MDTKLSIPRGKPGLPQLSLDMSMIYQAESRLKEISYVTPVTSRELSSFFNQATNESTKYLAWIEYEILQAKKTLDIAKAKVILEIAPVEANRLKEAGIKMNSEWREALIAMDDDCQKAQDILNALYAVKYLLEGKAKTFERAYFSAKMVAEERNMVSATPNLSGNIGQLYGNDVRLMGEKNGK
jgi:hypothetical protein